MFEPVSRDKLFYDSYQYCMQIEFAHSGRMRTLSQAAILQSVHWANRYRNHQGQVIDQHCVDSMLQLCDLLNSIDLPFKRVVTPNHQRFYSNYLEVFDLILGSIKLPQPRFTMAVIDRPRNTVCLQHSVYRWRSYFKERWYSADQFNTLRSFLLHRTDQFRITDYWKQKLNCNLSKLWVTQSNFVDHHSQQDSLLLQMVLPGSLRKTLPIIVTL